MNRCVAGSVRVTVLLLATTAMLSPEITAAAEAEPANVVAPAAPSTKPSKSASAVVAASNRFGARLVGASVKPNANRTVILSPYGVSTALTMLALGAEGRTRTVLHNGLGHARLTRQQVIDACRKLQGELAAASNEKALLKTANSVWLRHDTPANPQSKDTLAGAFSATLHTVDFASAGAADEINRWVKTATDGLIPKMIDSVDARAAFVLANAVYFKGAWARAFDPALTKPAPFTRTDGSTAEVPMMSTTMAVEYAVAGDHHAVSLPYHDGRFRLILLTSRVLKSGSVHGLVTSHNLADVLGGLAFEQSEVNLRLPRFRVELSQELTQLLATSGLAQAFAPRANYRQITRAKVEELLVLHRVFLDMNEAGTEAAAATAVVGTRELAAEPPTFSADRPFALALVERTTGVMLFLGYVGDPTVT